MDVFSAVWLYVLITIGAAFAYYVYSCCNEIQATVMEYFTIIMFWPLIFIIGTFRAFRSIPTLCRKLFGSGKPDKVIDLRSEKKPPSGGNRN